MESSNSRGAFDALASEHGIPILRYLRDRDWTLASQVSKALEIHTSTASKHLAALHEAGLLERQSHRAKRPTYAYRLPSPVVRIEIDLTEGTPPGLPEAAEAFVGALLHAARQLGGARMESLLVQALFKRSDWRPALKRRLKTAPQAAFESLARDALRTCEGLVGPGAAQRLLRLAVKQAGEGRGDALAFLKLPGVTAS